MRTYIIRRLILIIPTLLVATLIIFSIVRFIPGSALDLMLDEGGHHKQQTREQLEHELGLDLPIHIQYGQWVSGIFLRGDLGNSYWTNEPITRVILGALPVTFELGLLALIISIIVSLPIGIYSAIRQDTWGDYLGRSFSILLLAVPNFWLGLMVVIFPATWWGWSPPIMLIKFVDDPLGNLGMFIIPAIILGTHMAGGTMRMTRNMMLEVLRQDYIRTAWSKGMKERVVVIRHALKNAFIPVVTTIGYRIPILVGGSVIVESIFGLPGMGRLVVNAAFQRDYPMITGCMFVIAIFILLTNLMVDLSYRALDPRIQLDRVKE